MYPPLSFASSVSSHPPLHVSFSSLTERLQEPISHSCDLHPMLGTVSGVKVGRAKATCILHTGTQLTPPLLPTLSLVTVYTCKNTRAKEWTHSSSGHLSDKIKGLATLNVFDLLFVCPVSPWYSIGHKWYSNLMQTAANPGIWQQGLQLKSYF